MASAAAATTWRITGDYFENCSCDVVCPCLFSPGPAMSAQPTKGACDVPIGFHIDSGNYGNVSLDGLNAAVMAHTPGIMGQGNWSVALYIDERANDDQRQALQAIFSGQAGGTMAALAPLISTILGVKFVPITFTKNGMQRSMEIPGVAHLSVHALPGLAPDKEIWATGAHPFAPEGLAMAVGEAGSTYDDYGMHWDNSGQNGHYAPIAWSNA